MTKRMICAMSLTYMAAVSAAAQPVPDEWLTRAERTNFAQTARYDETVAYCKRLAEASDAIKFTDFGVSPLGRSLPLLIVSRDGAFTPQTAQATGKPLVLINNCIHPGECAGKDASLMLVRDIAVTGEHANLIDHAILLMIPIFNVDGYERFGPYNRVNQNGPEQMGWRGTSHNLNLNRDFVKADAAEMKAWLRLWTTWQPDLLFDNHTTNGADHRYELLYGIEPKGSAPAAAAEWMQNKWLTGVAPAMEKSGFNVMPYAGMIERADPSKGFRVWAASPRYSTGYAAACNRPGVLIEAHAPKTYEARVRATYWLVAHTLEEINRDPQALPAVNRAADAESAALGTTYDPDAEFPLSFRTTEESEPFIFKGLEAVNQLSEVSGGLWLRYTNKPKDYDSMIFRQVEPAKTAAPPLGYLFGPQWLEIVELCRLHGIPMRRLAEPVTAEFETYRFSGVTYPATSFEGRHQPSFKAAKVTESRTYPAGSIFVPMGHRLSRLVMHLFEPEGPDSLMTWGVFNAFLERKEYIASHTAEELARKMLAEDPQIKAEFEQRIKTDKEFAGNPRARLEFFYKRSPYWDWRCNAYPVARVTRKLDVPLEGL